MVYEDGLQKKFLTQKRKTHAIYYFNPLYGVCNIFYFKLLSLIHIEVLSRLKAF